VTFVAYLAYKKGMRHVAVGAAAMAVVAAGCGSQAIHPRADDPAAVIASVRDSLRTDRVEGAELRGARLSVRLRKVSSTGQSTVSLWYGKLLAQEVVNELETPVTEAEYVGTDANGGLDRRLRHSAPAHPLPADACRAAAESYATAPVRKVDQINVLGGACAFVVRPQDAKSFVYDAGGLVAGLRDLPGGPNARPTLIEVVDAGGSLRFVLTWIPAFGGAIGQGSAWVQPGWESSAIVGMPVTKGAPAPYVP
jgi:hypothetical protein